MTIVCIRPIPIGTPRNAGHRCGQLQLVGHGAAEACGGDLESDLPVREVTLADQLVRWRVPGRRASPKDRRSPQSRGAGRVRFERHSLTALLPVVGLAPFRGIGRRSGGGRQEHRPWDAGVRLELSTRGGFRCVANGRFSFRRRRWVSHSRPWSSRVAGWRMQRRRKARGCSEGARTRRTVRFASPPCVGRASGRCGGASEDRRDCRGRRVCKVLSDHRDFVARRAGQGRRESAATKLLPALPPKALGAARISRPPSSPVPKARRCWAEVSRPAAPKTSSSLSGKTDQSAPAVGLLKRRARRQLRTMKSPRGQSVRLLRPRCGILAR